MLNDDSFYSTSKFYGLNYFPYGINRCGEFTCREVALLENHGMAYQGIHKQVLAPRNKEEEQFLLVCKKERAPETDHEKVWVNFLKKTRKTAVSPFCGSPAAYIKFDDFSDEIWD